ncbi:hypothetical protein H1R20_g534, partial [Candolleomyces eurysporus]
MATTSTSVRRALSLKSLQASANHPQKSTQRHPSSASFKRPRSPEPTENSSTAKKARASTAISASALQKEKEAKRERLEREQQKQEFKDKYTRAFPSWTFYFDTENISMKTSQINLLKGRVEQLGGQVEEFFSKQITHLITDKPVPSAGSAKENRPNAKGSKAVHPSRSPIQLKSKSIEDTTRNNDVVAKANSYGIKIWNAAKLDSVLCRCLDSTSVNAVVPKTQALPTQKLERLLSKEKYYGAGDRDPTQKRYDYRYFSKGSFFVLVEDMRGEVATIAAHEYSPPKDKKTPWPVLHCHPHARGPFIPFDEKEKQRWERAQQKKNQEGRQAERQEKLAQLSKTKTPRLRFPAAKGAPDLRRSVSLNNMKRKTVESPEVDLDADGDVLDSANASGFLVSGAPHMAASGNSVTLTSTTGTTSTASGLRYSQLPAAFDLAMKRQILTSKKPASSKSEKKPEKKFGTMDPPLTVPNRQGLLKKAKSMSFKQPKREEGSKPGYCECCRQKFEDFKTVSSP